MEATINVRDLIEDATNDPESQVYVCATHVVCLDKSHNDGTWKVRTYRRPWKTPHQCRFLDSQALSVFGEARSIFSGYVALYSED